MPAYYGAFSAGVTHRDRENRVRFQDGGRDSSQIAVEFLLEKVIF